MSPHIHRENEKTTDNNETRPSDLKSPVAVAHNISINVTEADSPAGVRRRAHLRSLSDVTPASRAATPRARSHSERPRASPAPSPARQTSPLPPAGLAALTAPRAVRSARTSPNASRERLDDAPLDSRHRPFLRERFRSDTVTVLGDPWRKMSELDLRSAGGRIRSGIPASLDGPRTFDPWIKNSTLRTGGDAARQRSSSRDDVTRPPADTEQRRDGTVKRGKLERKAAVVCESCGNESCECWRPRSPGGPRTPRAARSLTGGAGGAGPGARCTCEPRSPRPSPVRLAPRQPVRALSDDEGRPRRLYKSASQKIICASMDTDSVKKPADPLLETTC